MATSSRSRPPQPNASDVRRIQDEEAYPYIITSEIGKGSFATVFKGYHSQSRRAFAIKTISRAILTHKLLDNLESEIAILKALNNKHITELVDIVKAPRNIYLIMEYCSGGDLSHYIRHRGKVQGLEYVPQPGSPPQFWPHPKSGGLDPVVVKSFLGQLAHALKFLRDRNLIHRDIKPQNLLLEPSTPADAPIPIGVPLLKIADFGFARSLPNAALAETLCGSPLYMAPEILRYEKYDAKADLWSVGAVVYEMSVGKPPFRAQNHMELLKKIEHARGRVNFPDEVVASKEATRGTEKDIIVTVVPPEIKSLIRMLLKRKPMERASFEQFFASEAVSEQFAAFAAHAAGSVGTDTIKALPPPSESSSSSLSVPAPNIVSSSTAPSKDGDATQPSASSKKHRDKSHKEREKAEPPLEGTPYDPKLYTPQTTLRFRRSHETDGRPQPIAGPSSSPKDRAGPPSDRARPIVQNSLTVEPSLLAYPAVSDVATGARGVAGPEESMNGSRRDKEYVLVGGAMAVEFDRVIDEIDAARKRPPLPTKHSSTGARGATAAAAALGKQVGRLVIGATVGSKSHQPSGQLPSNGAAPPITIVSPSSGSAPTTPITAIAQVPAPANSGQALTMEAEPGMILPSGTPPFATHMKRRSTASGQSSAPATPTTDTAIAPGEPASTRDPQSVPATPIPVPMTFPPPPVSTSSSSSPGNHLTGLNGERAGHSHQPNALVRAINLASKALFGSPTNGTTGGTPPASTSAGTSPSFPHSPGGTTGGANSNGLILKHDRPSPPSYPGTLDEAKTPGGKKPTSPLRPTSSDVAAVEDAVLALVEEVAQKAQVLKDYADKKFSRVEAVVSPPGGTSNYPSLLSRRRGEPAPRAPGAQGVDDRQRKKQLEAAELNAVQSIALYIAVMAFSQKGINVLNKYCQEHLDSKFEDAGEWSSGIDDALAWFRESFKTCVERSEIMKAWLPEGHQSPPMWIDRVVYDHALALMRQAASKEILEDNYAQIERDYERALWMLYAIADDVIQEENPYSEQDVQTINGFIDTTKARLMRLRRRIETRRAAAAAETKNQTQTQTSNGIVTSA